MPVQQLGSTTVETCEHPRHVLFAPTGLLRGRCLCGSVEVCADCGSGKAPGQLCRTCMKRQGQSFAERWRCECFDPGLRLFTAALKASGQDIAIGSDVLEIGCAEADWLTLAHAADPTLKLTGLDWRSHPRPHATVIQGDVLQQELDGLFDVIVSISAIEHIGLGHYDQDPLAEFGDTRTMQKAAQWLKPGGRMYLDVPFGDHYHVSGTSHRVYDGVAVETRLLQGWTVLWQGWAPRARAWELVPEPIEPSVQDFDHYVAMWVTPCS